MTNAERQLVMSAWLNGEFHNAIKHNDDLLIQAAAQMKAARDKGLSAEDAIRHCITLFVGHLIEPGKFDFSEFSNRN